MSHSSSNKLFGLTVILLALVGCASANDPALQTGTQASESTLTIEGLPHPVPSDLVINTVMTQREWLGAFMCPEQTLLLDIEPETALSPAHRNKLTQVLQSDGCNVVESTPETRKHYLNPATDEWRRERYKNAFISSVYITVRTDKGEKDLAIELGWYKGLMTAKSSTLLFRWDGSEWIERKDLKIITVS